MKHFAGIKTCYNDSTIQRRMPMLLPSPSIATVISECPLTSLASLAAICILAVATVSTAVSNPDSFLLNLCDGVSKFITPHKTLAEDLHFTNKSQCIQTYFPRYRCTSASQTVGHAPPRRHENPTLRQEHVEMKRLFKKRTATAGSDVVQSGRPIFDDFFQYLWPYIGNNTANVVFQMVKRLWFIRIDQ
ncbi:hypothetical protein TNCV_3916241 [Trichonephila clavipes]|nr:hypothetical protein TNCV_3916241 [Trichonephila clavipes]